MVKTFPLTATLCYRGAWICHRCAAAGSWYDLKRRAGGVEVFDARSPPSPVAQRLLTDTKVPTAADTSGRDRLVARQRAAGLQPFPDQQRVRSYPANLMYNSQFCHAREYLTGNRPGQRGIRIEVLIKYGVGCATYR